MKEHSVHHAINLRLRSTTAGHSLKIYVRRKLKLNTVKRYHQSVIAHYFPKSTHLWILLNKVEAVVVEQLVTATSFIEGPGLVPRPPKKGLVSTVSACADTPLFLWGIGKLQ